jgi:hypothetical protein
MERYRGGMLGERGGMDGREGMEGEDEVVKRYP